MLCEIHEGEGMGLYNAVNALAALSGSAVGGVIAGKVSYNAAWAMGAGGAGLGFLLSLFLKRMRTTRSPRDADAAG